jgi:hypothetical protein
MVAAAAAKGKRDVVAVAAAEEGDAAADQELASRAG